MELSQTIAALIGSIWTEKGCQRRDFCQSMEDENRHDPPEVEAFYYRNVGQDPYRKEEI